MKLEKMISAVRKNTIMQLVRKSLGHSPQLRSVRLKAVYIYAEYSVQADAEFLMVESSVAEPMIRVHGISCEYFCPLSLLIELTELYQGRSRRKTDEALAIEICDHLDPYNPDD